MAIKRVLYIEDNAMNMRLVKRLLTAKGYLVVEAADGLKGIAVAAREHPDLILMDINLPGIDGMEATSRLKSSSDLSHIPIVALTAVAMKGDRERILAAGCDDYLQKPINNALLLETVERFIGKSDGLPTPITMTKQVSSTSARVDRQPDTSRVVFVHKMEPTKTGSASEHHKDYGELTSVTPASRHHLDSDTVPQTPEPISAVASLNELNAQSTRSEQDKAPATTQSE